MSEHSAEITPMERQREIWWKVYELEQRLELLSSFAAAELDRPDMPPEGPFYQMSLAIGDIHTHAKNIRLLLTKWDWA